MLLLLHSVPPAPWKEDGDLGVPEKQAEANDFFLAVRLIEDE